MIIPRSDGHWDNPEQAGNAVWYPDMSCVPGRSNNPIHPHTFHTLLLMELAKPLDLRGLSPLSVARVKANILLLVSGARGVRFRNNEPDFSPFAIATVRLDKLLDSRYGEAGTMPLADNILSQRLGISEGELRQWINDKQYVWHESRTGGTSTCSATIYTAIFRIQAALQ